MSIDKFYRRKYNSDNYNCAHFVCEVWEHLTQNKITEQMQGFLLPVANRRAPFSLRREFTRLLTPESPCIALMLRPGYASHVGIFIDGKIFHIRKTGVEYQPVDVASFGFKTIRYYKC